MGGNVNFRNDFHEVGCRLFLEVDEFFLGVRAVTGCQSRISLRFQPESSVSLVPVVLEVLLESIIVQMDLQGVHFVVSHDFHQVLQISHRNELTATVYHETAKRIIGIITNRSLRERAFLILFRQLQECACAPVKTGRGGSGDGYTVGYLDGVTFLTELLVCRQG